MPIGPPDQGPEETLSIKGVSLRSRGLSDAARRYLDGKLRRIRRRERRRQNPFHRLYQALLPGDYRVQPIESLVSGHILVIGCNGGIETLTLGAIGIDINREALRIATELKSHAIPATAHFLAASAGDLPFRDATFDSLLSDNVVEHLPDPLLQRHLREARRVVMPQGRYLLTSPNRLFEHPPDEEHISLHTYEEWETMLRKAGFARVETPRRRSGHLGATDWKKKAELRAARSPFRLGMSNKGLRLVTLAAYPE